MTPEQWRPIPGFLGYFASDHGRIASQLAPRGWRLRKATAGKHGYLNVGLEIGGGRHRTKNVHSLILLTFVGPRPEGMVCRHLNGAKADNRLANLAWGTSSENAIDVVDHGQHHYAIRDCCKYGHPYTPDNTRMEPRPNGREARRCRTCALRMSRESKARSRARRRSISEAAA